MKFTVKFSSKTGALQILLSSDNRDNNLSVNSAVSSFVVPNDKAKLARALQGALNEVIDCFIDDKESKNG